MKIITWGLSAVLLAVILFLGVAYFIPGFGLSVVQSDSMKPVFSAGDVIVTAPVGFLGKYVVPGAVVSFVSSNRAATHRVYSMDGQGGLITKGDANTDADYLAVPVSAVTGMYLFKIPVLGYLDAFLHTRNGWFEAVVLPALLLVVWLAIEIVREVFKGETSYFEVFKGEGSYEDINNAVV